MAPLTDKENQEGDRAPSERSAGFILRNAQCETEVRVLVPGTQRDWRDTAFGVSFSWQRVWLPGAVKSIVSVGKRSTVKACRLPSWSLVHS